MVIRNVTLSDAGEYFCKANNSLGKVYTKVTLAVNTWRTKVTSVCMTWPSMLFAFGCHNRANYCPYNYSKIFLISLSCRIYGATVEVEQVFVVLATRLPLASEVLLKKGQ